MWSRAFAKNCSWGLFFSNYACFATYKKLFNISSRFFHAEFISFLRLSKVARNFDFGSGIIQIFGQFLYGGNGLPSILLFYPSFDNELTFSASNVMQPNPETNKFVYNQNKSMHRPSHAVAAAPSNHYVQRQDSDLNVDYVNHDEHNLDRYTEVKSLGEGNIGYTTTPSGLRIAQQFHVIL